MKILEVVIPEGDMPECCLCCGECCTWEDGKGDRCGFTGSIIDAAIYWDSRMPDCPLVELQKKS